MNLGKGTELDSGLESRERHGEGSNVRIEDRESRDYRLLPLTPDARASSYYDGMPEEDRPGIGYRAKIEDLQIAGQM